MPRLNWKTRACILFLLAGSTAISSPAQTFKTLHSFDSTDGAYPIAGLSQATDGNLYGTAVMGGANGYGSIFKITPGGTLTTLHSFNDSDGAFPQGTPVQAPNGILYGTTPFGGTGAACAGGCGTVFKITPSGTLTTLYSFGSQSGDGAYPQAGLTRATDGNFYGTTQYGGIGGFGTVFKITPNGTLTTLYSFCSQSGCPDGAEPVAGLVQAADGNLYGTTQGYPGTSTEDGTVFKITTAGALTTLHAFDFADGALPFGALVQAGPNLYGTTYNGGEFDSGTLFKITPTGTLTTLYSFCSQVGCADGTGPVAGLLYATDGNLYGTTYLGGAHGGGTAFEITLNGALTALHAFNYLGNPEATLLQDTNGAFYGTTQTGGAHGDGTVFSLSVGLGPFVETLPTAGKVGAAINILGTNLTGATSVTFNGASAAFTVVSASLITATVPAGATSGKVQVVTPGHTLSSSARFLVLP